MASISLTLTDRFDVQRFDRLMREAGAVATDMISVRTALEGEAVVKTVRTNCSGAIAVFRNQSLIGAAHV